MLRTSRWEGVPALHRLIGVCWNWTQWALAELPLPPVPAPTAAPEVWKATAVMDLAAVPQRAGHSGLRLSRGGRGAVLEVAETAGTAASVAWRRWLQQLVQLRLPLTG